MLLVKAVPRGRWSCGDTSSAATKRFSRYRGWTLRITSSAVTSGRPTATVKRARNGVGCYPLKAPSFKLREAQWREFASSSPGVKRSARRKNESRCSASDVYLKSWSCWAKFGTSFPFFYIYIHKSQRRGGTRGQATSGCHGVAVGKRQC